VSRQLTDEFVTTWKQSHPAGQVVVRDLNTSGLPLVDAAWIGAVFTPADARTVEQKTFLSISDTLVDELKTADEYVIGVPMYNFSIPGILKIWIDQVVRAGLTFSYSSTSFEGLLKDKKVTFLVASSGAYPKETPAAAMNFVEPYLQAIFGFIGVTDVKFIWAEGLAQTRSGTINLQDYLVPIRESVRAQAISWSPVG
jgi:FMN-dependent NADH-azoreductase